MGNAIKRRKLARMQAFLASQKKDLPVVVEEKIESLPNGLVELQKQEEVVEVVEQPVEKIVEQIEKKVEIKEDEKTSKKKKSLQGE